jgi:restriction endonuclease S subunit
MTELPTGWGSCLLDEINDPERPICYGILMPGPDLPDGIPYVKVRNIRADKVLVDEVHRTSVEIESKFARSRLRTGDVLVSIRGTYGRTAPVPSELDGGNITQDTARVAPVGASAAYVRLFMQSPAAQNYFKAVARGVAVKGVNIGDLRKLPVPVAPVAEQERIVAAIDEGFSKLDAGEAGLRTVRQLLRRTRDAILSAAATGCLVPQDPGDTPAATLLADLGVAVPAGANNGLPDSWERLPLGQVAEVRLGRQRSPERATGPRMRPYLRAGNIGWTGFRLDDVKEMSFTEAESEIFELVRGDLLLSEASGSPGEVGKPAQYRDEVEGGCCFQNTLIRVRLRAGLDPDYYEHFFRNEARTGRFAAGSRGVGIHHLGQKALNVWLVPVPPPEEQARILAEVERQMSFIEACERSVDAGLEVSAALRRSVLKAAFEGRLVSQDPTDEPASVLLDRIRAEREATPKSKKQRARATA